MDNYPPRGPAGHRFFSSDRVGPIENIQDDSQSNGPERNKFAESDDALKALIPQLFNTYIFHQNNTETVDMWNRMLNIAGITSRSQLTLIMNMISDVLTNEGFPYNKREYIDRLKTFLNFNTPPQLKSCFTTQPQHTQQLCTLLESLHTRVSALEARRA